MIQQGDIIAGSHLQTFVGVAGDSLIMLQHLIFDTGIAFRVSSADLSHVSVLAVAAVRQAQLPVLIGLGLYAVQKLCQQLLRRIVKGRQNAELHHIGKYGLSLGLCFLRTWEAGSAVALHILALLQLTSYLPHNPGDRAVTGQTIPCLFIKMQSLPKGNRQLPGKASLDAIQLEIQLLDLLLGLFDFAYENLGFLPFCLVKLFIIHLFLIIHSLLHNSPVLLFTSFTVTYSL